MIETLNFTGRQPIRHEWVDLRVARMPEGAIRLQGSVDLSPLTLSEDHRVVLEAYRQIYSARAEISSPEAIDVTLPDFASPGSLLLNVRVISTVRRGLVLAAAEQVKPESSEDPHSGGRSLLPVELAQLGQAIWRLDLTDDSGPVLQLNSSLDDAQALARTPEFQLLVYPQVLHEVARWLTDRLDAAAEEGRASEWLAFFEALGVTVTPRTDPADDPAWIAEAFDQFVQKQRILDQWSDLKGSRE